MQSAINRLASVFAVALLVTAGGCSRQGDDAAGSLAYAGGQLRFVPADTPYLLATPGNLPDDLADRLEPALDQALGAYRDILRAVVANAAANDAAAGNPGMPDELRSLMDGLGSFLSVEGLNGAGIDRHSHLAIYGMGLLPVMRLSLTDGDLMEAAISRLEEDAGEKMGVAALDDRSYRYVGNEAVRLIVAVFDDELLVTAVPANLSEDNLRRVLGFVLPDQNIAQSGVLAAAARRHGLGDVAIGMIDVERLAAAFVDEPSGIDAELLAIMQYDASVLSGECRGEIRAIAGIAPRLVSGYTELSAEGISSKLVVEFREDIAAGLATLTGAVPGLGQRHGGVFSFGVGLDLLALRDFYAAQLDKLDAAPYRCELLAGIQDGATSGRQALDQPLPPIIYGIKGILAVVDDIGEFDPGNLVPPSDIELRLVLATDNPDGLIAMGAMFSPDLAALDLQPDGRPVRFDAPQLAALGRSVHLAMTDGAIGVALGDGPEAELQGMLAAQPAAPAPFFSMEMDAQRYYAMAADAVAADSGLDQDPEVKASIQELNAISLSLMDRIALDVIFTEQGVEFLSDVRFKQ